MTEHFGVDKEGLFCWQCGLPPHACECPRERGTTGVRYNWLNEKPHLLTKERGIKGGRYNWLKEAIIQRPDRVQVRLASSFLYEIDTWDIWQILKETWRWQ